MQNLTRLPLLGLGELVKTVIIAEEVLDDYGTFYCVFNLTDREPLSPWFQTREEADACRNDL